MDFCKNIGKNKELIEKEHQARRNYSKKWGNLLQPHPHNLYNPNELNEQLRKQLPEEALSFYKYSGHGDSYFVSGEMYESLVAKCRCGRPRTCGHVLKCLQKENDKYKEEDKLTVVQSQDVATNGEQSNECISKANEIKMSSQDAEKLGTQATINKEKSARKVLATTNALIGWRPAHSRYNQWEKSMKYVSPVLTMSGPRITAIPYNAIIIG